MKNIFLIAKHKVLSSDNNIITRADVQTALNNVTILDEDISSFIYDIFDLDFGLPRAHYTEQMLKSAQNKSTVKVENSLKRSFNKIKQSKFKLDIMNISVLNNVYELEDKYLNYAQKRCKNIKNYHRLVSTLLKCNYVYDVHEAVQELGLDEELIEELLDEYVEQIFNTNVEFVDLMALMWEKDFLGISYSFEPFMNLVHKNLGVAKNLRIKDAVFILSTIQKLKDLDLITIYLDILISCTIKLRPKLATLSAIHLTIKSNGFQTI